MTQPKATVSVFFCPRCDRRYDRKDGESYTGLLNRVIFHVSQQHPDHDPEWWDTFKDVEEAINRK